MSAARYALCRTSDNVVVNTTLWDPVAAPNVNFGAGIEARAFGNLKPRIGATFDGTTVGPLPAISQERQNQAAIVAKAQLALAANDAFLAIPSPTQGQTLTYVQVVAKELNALVRLALGLYDSTQGT